MKHIRIILNGKGAADPEVRAAILAEPLPLMGDAFMDTIIDGLGSYQGMANQVLVKARGAEPEAFDHVFIACHSDQALALLADPTEAEREVLGAMPYQRNEAVLHTDAALLPKRRLAWAAWNYNIPRDTARPDGKVTLTYNMNILQGLQAPETFCVTLNSEKEIDPSKVLYTVEYAHPVFNTESVDAQKRHNEISGVNRTHYCGAYWGNGFHEDGVNSALKPPVWSAW